MMTFLPYPDFYKSAEVIDPTRLSNQRNECKTIIKTLLGMFPVTKTGRKGGWPYHPATNMWRGYEFSLRRYAVAICHECNRRGVKDNKNLEDFFRSLPITGFDRIPAWLGGHIHATHRASLLLKDPVWYGQFGWKEKPEDNYFWPV